MSAGHSPDDTPIPFYWPSLIFAYRKSKKLSQLKFAGICNISDQVIWQIENHRKTTVRYTTFVLIDSILPKDKEAFQLIDKYLKKPKAIPVSSSSSS